MGLLNDDHPITDLVASNVLSLIAIHGDLDSEEDLDKIKPESELSDLSINDEIKKKILLEFEKSLGTIYVGEEKYVFHIETKIQDILTVADLISAVLTAMQDIAKKVSE